MCVCVWHWDSTESRLEWKTKQSVQCLQYSFFLHRKGIAIIGSHCNFISTSCHNICLRLNVFVKVSPLPALCFPFPRFSRCSSTLQHGAHRGIRARRGEQNDDTHHQLAGEPVPGRCSMNNNKSLILMYRVLGQRRSLTHVSDVRRGNMPELRAIRLIIFDVHWCFIDGGGVRAEMITHQ